MAHVKYLPLYDIYQVSWLDFKGIQVRLSKLGNRVVFEVPANDETYRLLREYQSNPQVPLLDMVGCLRRIRARMLDLRDANDRRERVTKNDNDNGGNNGGNNGGFKPY